MEYETSEFNQETWNNYLMLGFVSPRIAINIMPDPEQQLAFEALRSDLLLSSATTLSTKRWREYSLTVDANYEAIPITE